MGAVYFNTSEAAAALGINTRTLLRWVESGRIAPLRPVPPFLFTGEEVGRVSKLPRPKRGGWRGRRSRPEPPGLFPRPSTGDREVS